jgi:hypothetical protein
MGILEVLVIGYAINRLMQPTKQDFIKWIKKWEGGKSRATTDTAISDGGPGGVHTNKGVRWSTYKDCAKACGYTPTAKDFLEMSDKRWEQIFDTRFWNYWQGDKLMLRSPFLAFYVVQFAWGFGNSGAESRLANFQRKYMGIKDSDITPNEIVRNFMTTPTPIKILGVQMISYKESVFRSLGQPANLKGWLNRLQDFKKQFLPTA